MHVAGAGGPDAAGGDLAGDTSVLDPGGAGDLGQTDEDGLAVAPPGTGPDTQGNAPGDPTVDDPGEQPPTDDDPGDDTPDQPQTPQGSDSTGLTDEKITIGIHAPVTGAAPLPVTSFESSRDLYWRYVTEMKNETVLGRTEVEVLFRDDRYDPNSAVQVCRELAQKAFFLVGGGGTDQIQACARFSNQARVPYFSAGVTENGLAGLPWYFASSMTYKQQGPLLAKYLAANFRGRKVAAIITDTPNFDDAVAGWEQGVSQAGLDYYKTLRHPKGDTSWYNSFAADLKQNGVEVVYLNTAPVDYIRFAQQANNQGFEPQFVGVGITMGLNAVLGSGCDDVDGGIFLSPFPGLDWARKNEAAFFEAGQRLGAPTDDIALALWGIAKQEHALFERYGEVFGNDLFREDFRAVVEQQRDVASGVFPSVTYTPQAHFGARTAHVLQADCSKREHVTLATFASGF
ncbi:MAG: ABC transporter substrate-binding protein [Nitriliruptorales bacterium]